jgi:hypothetical protein
VSGVAVSPKFTFYAGWWFWPITALSSFFGTLSFFLSLLCSPDRIPGPIGEWLQRGLVLFFAAGLFLGVLGVPSLLWCGLGNVGRLTIRGRCLYGKRLGIVFLLMYLPSFALVGLSVLGYSLAG